MANEMHETPWSERFRATAEVTARTALAAGIMLWGLSKVLSAHQAAMAHRLDPVGASASARDIGLQL